ncbi:MAG: hypothetical protein WDW38_008574 [Sanguina aurantia]
MIAMAVPTASSSSTSFFDIAKRIAKQVQGALPIVGLVSRLVSPEGGGFEEMAYQEYTRSMYEKSSSTFTAALLSFETTHGKPATRKFVLLMLWMATTGGGLVPPRDTINAARRLRVTQDIEIEIDRFEMARSVTLEKYNMMARPEATLQEKVVVAVDTLCVMSLGLKDGVAIPESEVAVLGAILQGAFLEATPADIALAISSRTQRAATYLLV